MYSNTSSCKRGKWRLIIHSHNPILPISTCMDNSILSSPPLKPSLLPRASATASSSSSPFPPTSIIIGGGLSGLAAATHLHSTSTPFLLLDSSSTLGGRLQTDHHNGFLLDRGFQIFLTSYPESRSLLHLPSLHLQPFFPGALIYYNNHFHLIADPFRKPISSLPSLFNPIGSISDKLLVALHRIQTLSQPDSLILSSPETTISHFLSDYGFSPSIINTFFRPFLAGIFFDKDLTTTSRLFNFIVKSLASGDNALPAAGIAAIPNQLVANLPPQSIRLNTRAVAVDLDGNAPIVRLESGETLAAEMGLIVAVQQPEAKKLIPTLLEDETVGRKRSTVCMYFQAQKAAVSEPILILNGSGEGIVNNMFFATNVAPSYGPEGKVLVSVSLVGGFEERTDEELTAEVVRELGGWFGEEEVREWRHLRTYRIGFAQPDQTPPTNLVGKDPRVGRGVYVCGDYRSSATFDGALVSGRRAAEALVEDLRR